MMSINDISLKLEKNKDYKRIQNFTLKYGTAGFRDDAAKLSHVAYRMGILASLRSKLKDAAVGLMITASHNKEPDNGIKAIDPLGEMMDSTWEAIATSLVNQRDSDLPNFIVTLVKEQNIDLTKKSTIIIGRDTRVSSESLKAAAVFGAGILDSEVKDFGVLTTPQLHFLVASINKNPSSHVSIETYNQTFSRAFNKSWQLSNNNSLGRYTPKLKLDAANGVGALAVKEFQKYLDDNIKIDIVNDGDGKLNEKCGADFVKIQQTLPLNFAPEANVRCVSFDGDADRIVYFYTDEHEVFHLLDGDRIATLVAQYVKELLDESAIGDLSIGIVQTAYANGGSTNYIKEKLKFPQSCVPTGVKHLHHKAQEYDIGIYFEANGHGTVLFQDRAMAKISETSETSNSEQKKKAALKLLRFAETINQTVGDALSDLLIVETILHDKDWDLAEWRRCYEDLPNKQLKVLVKDRNVIKTADAERVCVEPKGLQEEIDKLLQSGDFPRGRSFVRASGTEDVVRVYAEAENAPKTEKLSRAVALLVHKLAGGDGPEPQV